MKSLPSFDALFSAPRDFDKLTVLRQQDTARFWSSLDDERVCVLCGNEFQGHEVHVQIDQGQISCHCPTHGCRGRLNHFVFSGNPLTDPKVWSDWMLALDGGDALEQSA